MDDSFSTDLLVDPLKGDHGDIRNLEITVHDHEHGHDDDNDHDHCEVSADPGTAGVKTTYHHKHEKVETLFYTNPGKLDPDLFGKFLQNLPHGLARAKGFVQFGGPRADGAKYLLQVVGSRPDLQRREWQTEEKRQCALVFLGREVNIVDLKTALDSAMVT